MNKTELPHSISAFFPCYNDAGTIASMVVLTANTLKKLTDDYEIIVIDDGSSDRSREVLRELERRFSRLRVIYHEKNRGYGGALRSGFSAAGKELVFYTDGDFQYDVTELRKLYNALTDDVEVVNGYKIDRHDPLYRVIIGKTYQRLMKFLFNIRIKDVDCDFRLIRRQVFDKVNLEYDSGVICIELIKKLQDAGYRFNEVSVNHFFRSYGKSQFFNLKRLRRVGADLITLWWKLVVKKEAIRDSASGHLQDEPNSEKI